MSSNDYKVQGPQNISLPIVMLLIITTIFSFIYIICIGLNCVGILASLRRFVYLKPKPLKDQPHVVIIKPIKGYDSNLEQNLLSFIDQTYHSYKVYFCIESEEDPAIAVLKKLKKTHPDKTEIMIQQQKMHSKSSSVMKNPKVLNMQMAWNTTTSKYVWMADAKVFAEPDTLTCMIAEIEKSYKTAVVHCTPLFKNHKINSIESLYFYTQHGKMYDASDVLNIPCLTGMSVLVKRELIDDFGGLDSLEDYLAEDFYMCKFLTENGWKLKLSRKFALQNAGDDGGTTVYAERMLRWYKLRKSMVPFLAFIEPLFECLPSMIYGMLSIKYLLSYFELSDTPLTMFFAFHMISWLIFDIIQASLLNAKFCFLNPYFYRYWIGRQMLFIYIFFKGNFTNTNRVNWAGQTYKLRAGKLIAETRPLKYIV